MKTVKNFRKMEVIKANQMGTVELKSPITKMLSRLSNGMEMTKDRLIQLEDRSMKYIQFEPQRNNRFKQKLNKASQPLYCTTSMDMDQWISKVLVLKPLYTLNY